MYVVGVLLLLLGGFITVAAFISYSITDSPSYITFRGLPIQGEVIPILMGLSMVILGFIVMDEVEKSKKKK